MIFPLVLTIGCAPVSTRGGYVRRFDVWKVGVRTNTDDGESLMREDGLFPAVAA